MIRRNRGASPLKKTLPAISPLAPPCAALRELARTDEFIITAAPAASRTAAAPPTHAVRNFVIRCPHCHFPSALAPAGPPRIDLAQKITPRWRYNELLSLAFLPNPS